MYSFHKYSFGIAVLLSALFMGVLGAFVVIPIACIQWAWNAVAPSVFALPVIHPWQAILLYLAFAIALFLSGLKIEIKMETLE